MPRYCKNCGNTLEHDEVFCSDCGVQNPIKKTIVCPNCGSNTQDSLNYCENCGANINTTKIVKKSNSFIDNNKNMLIIIATAIVVVIIIAATLSITHDVGTRIVSVGSAEFSIPGDYNIDPATIDVDYTGYTATFSQGYSNGKDSIFIGRMLDIPNVDSERLIASQGGTHKTLMGESGYYLKRDGLYLFAFDDGTYLNVIGVTDPDIFDDMKYLG